MYLALVSLAHFHSFLVVTAFRNHFITEFSDERAPFSG